MPQDASGSTIWSEAWRLVAGTLQTGGALVQPQPAVTTRSPTRGSPAASRIPGVACGVGEPHDCDVVTVVDARSNVAWARWPSVAIRGAFGQSGMSAPTTATSPPSGTRATQCAAVRTMSGSISVPPQRWLSGVSARRSDTMKRYELDRGVVAAVDRRRRGNRRRRDQDGEQDAGKSLPSGHRDPFYHRAVIPEARFEETEDGPVLVGPGWFVLNARDARWTQRPGRASVSFTGRTEWEADTFFPMLGVNLAVIEPGEPSSTYHWETETEAFLVLSGEALLIVEGQERPLRQWDFVHCPPKTEHVIVGAGDGPCVVLAMSSRENQQYGPYGVYVANEVARRYGASPDHDTQDTDEAYAGRPDSTPSRYRDGWLPGA